MDARVLAYRYAKTLAQADSDFKLKPLLQSLHDALKQQPIINEKLSDPSIKINQKLSSLKNSLGDQTPDILLKFFDLLASKNRLPILNLILEEYIKIQESSQGIVRGVITSAYPLDENQIKTLTSKLNKNPQHTLILEQKINSDLIGGFQVQIGDLIYDWSISTQLKGFRHRFMTGAV